MGIGMALVAFAIVGTVLAGITGIVIAFITALITRGAPKRRNAIIAAIFFPFACLGRCGAIFGFQAIMNEDFFHRDAGLGDAWQCPLPNGYGILMIDTTAGHTTLKRSLHAEFRSRKMLRSVCGFFR
jgi:hypothetical protein